MKSIVLINCFFGEFPWYFPIFIKSCSTNPTIDFIIFSDSKCDIDLPKNVRLVRLKMSDFNQLASLKLNLNITIDNPYKLCDFKPVYGFIFSDYVENYDYWGACDLDIILGRIRQFITTEILTGYDVISTRHDYMTGWFMLFKNSAEINTLFKKSRDYEKVFTSNTHYCFDESNFKHLQIEDGESSILDIECEIESMEHVIRKGVKENRITAFFDLMMVDGLCGRIKWNKGILTYNSDYEILLYHLIRYKSNQFSQKTFWKTIPDSFYIDKYVFRKQAITTVFGALNYMYFNKIEPSFSRKIQYLKFFISNALNSKTIIELQNGMYKNKESDVYIWLYDKHLFFYTLESAANLLIQSKFDDSLFFIKKSPSLKCRYFVAGNGVPPKIQLTYFDGSIINYELTIKN